MHVRRGELQYASVRADSEVLVETLASFGVRRGELLYIATDEVAAGSGGARARVRRGLRWENGRMEMGDGRWEVGGGRWEVGCARWEVGDGRWDGVTSGLGGV